MLRGTAPHAVVVGSPVAHSLSPLLHRAAWEELGLAGGSYERVEVAQGGLARAVEQLHGERGVTALSVTAPLKEEALELAESGAGANEVARRAGGANTLVLQEQGWAADNTDVPGLARVIARHAPLQARAGGPAAVLLGSGATARSALLALHRCGVGKVEVLVRSRVRPELRGLAADLGVSLTEGSLDRLGDRLTRGAPVLVVSTLPAGWCEEVPAPRIPREAQLVTWVDAQYADWPHPWAAALEDSGATVVSGLHMLVEQAVDQVGAMTGLRPSVDGAAALLPTELRTLHRL